MEYKRPCSEGSCINKKCKYFENCTLILTCFTELMPNKYLETEIEKNKMLDKIRVQSNNKQEKYEQIIMKEQLKKIQIKLCKMEQEWREKIICKLK